MTTEQHAWTTFHPFAQAEHRLDTCSCGQELDTCRGSHCPRCGSSVGLRRGAA